MWLIGAAVDFNGETFFFEASRASSAEEFDVGFDDGHAEAGVAVAGMGGVFSPEAVEEVMEIFFG